MAIKQYIGARYVPLPDGAYDSTKEYEPLTLVNYGQATYISKKKVPAGVAPTDSEYWMWSGSGSQGVAELEAWKTQTVEPFMSETSQHLVEIDMAISEAEGDISNLDGRVTNLEESGGGAKRYVIVSDSYGDVSSDFMTRLKNLLGVGNDDWFQIARSGYGVDPSYGNYKFIDLLGELTVTSPETITDVIVAGGFNDRAQNEATLFASMSDLVAYCKNRFTNATVHFAAIGWSFNAEHVRELRCGAYIRTYKRCVELGANYLNGTEYIMRVSDLFVQEPDASKNLGVDFVHPNVNGAIRLAAGIAEALKTGKTSTEYIVDGLTIDTSTNPNISQVTGDLTFFEKTCDGVATLCKKNYAFAAVYFENPIVFDGSSPIEIGMIRSGVIAGQSPTAASNTQIMSGGTMNGFVALEGPTNVYSTSQVLLLNNRLYIQPMCNRNDRIIAIGIYGINITIDADLV